jgi:uncharacterized RDD family membrane protein YckC
MRLSPNWIAFSIFLAFLPLFFLGKQEVGFSIEIKNGVTRVAGGSSPSMLLVVLIVLFLFFNMPGVNREELKKAGMRRRFFSIVLDSFLSIFFFSATAGLIPMALEFARTKEFAWQFERDYLTPSDKLFGLPLVLITMFSIFMYFAYPMSRGKQTIGEYVLGLKVVGADGVQQLSLKQAMFRTVLGYVALCAAPITLILGKDKQGRTWYDKVTECRVLRVQSGEVELWP